MKNSVNLTINWMIGFNDSAYLEIPILKKKEKEKLIQNFPTIPVIISPKLPLEY